MKSAEELLEQSVDEIVEKMEKSPFKGFYNKYIDYYNNKDPIRVLSDFRDVALVLENKIAEINESLSSRLQSLKEEYHEALEHISSSNQITDIDGCKQKLKEFIELIEKSYLDSSLYLASSWVDEPLYDKRLEQLGVDLCGYLKEEDSSDVDYFMFSLETLLLNYLEIKRYYTIKENVRMNLEALKSVLNNIIVEGYPKKPLTYYENLPTYEKQKMVKEYRTGGKPYDFSLEKTKKWFFELYGQEDGEYQRNSKPYFSKIDQELIKRHKEDPESDGKPSLSTMKSHRRKLSLMNYHF